MESKPIALLYSGITNMFFFAAAAQYLIRHAVRVIAAATDTMQRRKGDEEIADTLKEQGLRYGRNAKRT